MLILRKSPEEIQDKELTQLFEEFDQLGLPCFGRMILHCLQMPFFPDGIGGKPTRITQDQLGSLSPVPKALLDTQVGKLGAVLHGICSELAQQNGTHVEKFHGVKLANFLHRMMPLPPKKKRKPSPYRERI